MEYFNIKSWALNHRTREAGIDPSMSYRNDHAAAVARAAALERDLRRARSQAAAAERPASNGTEAPTLGVPRRAIEELVVLDSAGRLLLTRIDPSLKARWRSELPVAELHNRWELPERLLLLGSAPSSDEGRAMRQEWLLSVDLATGRVSAWSLQKPGPVPDSSR